MPTGSQTLCFLLTVAAFAVYGQYAKYSYVSKLPTSIRRPARAWLIASRRSCPYRKDFEMIRVLFVCHGNICRSPMAEFVMKDLVKKAHLEDEFEIASAATSTEEIWGGRGNPVYPPARAKLKEHGIDPGGKRARRTTREDYKYYDYLIGMDYANVYNMKRIYGGDPDGKISLLLDHCGRAGQEVADPWYTDNFDATWDDVLQGCTALLGKLRKEL